MVIRVKNMHIIIEYEYQVCSIYLFPLSRPVGTQFTDV